MVPSQKPSAKGRRYWAERYLVFNKVNKVCEINGISITWHYGNGRVG
ncbi:hypothetical protein UVI_02035990 [Ustilaginoidea virens]|uniref:Uncharacterized protein n=1 Tax=Ustilaginoidea virens TaxID=1159556 RepID=A0A1B5KSZ3_USTVR|nr:hypothetical protein UVI_02035990 [Ustilaginoidea virens]